MSKSIRSFVLVATLAVSAVPSLYADRTGCNPHPQPVAPTPTSQIATIVYTVISSLTL